MQSRRKEKSRKLKHALYAIASGISAGFLAGMMRRMKSAAVGR